MARSPPSRVRTGGLEAHQVFGQDAIGADFNSLSHISVIESLRRSPELKEVLSSATAAVKTAPKEEAAAVASEVRHSTRCRPNWQLFASSKRIRRGFDPDVVSLQRV
jgi:hypothetical protein